MSNRTIGAIGHPFSRLMLVIAVALPLVGFSPSASAQDDAEGPASLITPDPLEPIVELAGWRALQGWLSENANLELEVGYTLVMQAATDVEDEANTLISGSFDIGGEWAALEHEKLGNGSLGFLVEGGQIISHNDDEDLSANIGTAFGINDDLDNTDIALTELWWAQTLPGDVVTITAGKIDQSAFFDANRIANDETAQFLATPLVNSPSIAFPDNGLGFNVLLQLTPEWYVTTGLGDGRAIASHSPEQAFAHGDIFFAIETGIDVEIGERTGTYRVMLWRSEADNVPGYGVALSFDQEIAEQVVGFFRYGATEDDIARAAGLASHFVSGGVGLEGPLGRADDMVGVGYAWAVLPASGTTDSESMIESFYRLQLTDTITVSPHLQFVFDPADSTDSGMVTVFGLRTQFTF